MTLTIDFGALAPRLRVQLKGLGIAASHLKHYQEDADAITRLSIRGLLPESAVHRARRKLMDRIAGEVRP